MPASPESHEIGPLLVVKKKSILKAMMLLGFGESYVEGACCSESDRVDKEEE
jgi:hypothetical protein